VFVSEPGEFSPLGRVKDETGQVWINVVLFMFYYVTAVVHEGLLSFSFVLFLFDFVIKGLVHF